MDSFTHIALGSCVGEAILGKRIGLKAMAWGAVAQSIADIDFISSFWLSTPDSLMAHRGITHSILFNACLVPVFTYFAHRAHRTRHIPIKDWLLFFAVELFLHLFIDGFNNYGIGWLEPFSHQRYSFNAIYVVDPFFSASVGIAFVALLILRRGSAYRRFWYRLGLIVTFSYLAYCTINKLIIQHDVEDIFVKQHIPHTQSFTTPAPLQDWLWFVVSGNDTGYYVGYRSLFDGKKEMDFHYFPRNDSLARGIKESHDLATLIHFSQGFYTIEKWRDTLVFNDLRFGQIVGWQNPEERFAFHYYLSPPQGAQNNRLVVQRGRFAKWNWKAAKALWKRIMNSG